MKSYENIPRRLYHLLYCHDRKYNYKKCDEGKIYWVDKDKVLTKDMTVSIRHALEHYLKNEMSKSL